MSILLDHVSKSYGRTLAVDDLSFEVRPGELFAFLGPNGAGKTTTIKMMVGLLLPDRGTIRVCGHLMGVNGLEAKSRLAYVPDLPFVYEKLSGREFLEFVGRVYRVPAELTQSRIDQYAHLLRLTSSLDRLAESYSHGMKQKLVLAASLLHDPDVLIVDEPMVGLDPASIRTVKQLFRRRADEGKIVFMSTHTLEIAEALADRIAIIHRGRIVAIDSIEGLRRQRASRQTLEDIFLMLTDEAGDEAAPTGDRA